MNTYDVRIVVTLRVRAVSTQRASYLAQSALPREADKVNVLDVQPLNPSVNRLRDDFGRTDIESDPPLDIHDITAAE